MELNDDSKHELNVVPKTCQETSQLSDGYFPEALLMEIIRRLPFKSILRSKCVCMLWYSLISDKSFAQFYISCLSPLLQYSFWAKIYVPWFSSGVKSFPFAFVSNLMYRTEGIQAFAPPLLKLDVDSFCGDNESRDVYSLALPSAQKPEESENENISGYGNVLCMYENYEIVAVNLDIVLYTSDNSFLQYYICNPFTGQWIKLPPASHSFQWVSSGFIARVENGMLMSYTVVRFNSPLGTGIFKFEVFASETGEWKSFDMFVGGMLQFCPRTRPTSFNGNLHWLLFYRDGILAYDPDNHPGEYRIIPLPEDNNIIQLDNTRSPYGYFNNCVARGGCLKYIEMSESLDLKNGSQHLISVWKLNDYDTGEWCLEHKVLSCDILADGLSHISPYAAIILDFDPSCEDVLYLGCLNCILSYNFRTKKLKAHGTPVLPDFDLHRPINFPCWRFVFLLAPIPKPTLMPLPSSNRGNNLLMIQGEEA